MFLDAKEERARNGRRNYDESIEGGSLSAIEASYLQVQTPRTAQWRPVTDFLYELLDTKKSIG